MDADEWDVYRETTPMKQEAATLINAGVPKAHVQLVRTMRPLVTQMMAQQLAAVANETPEQAAAREDAEAAECERMLSSPGPDWPSPNGIDGEPAPSPNGRNGLPSPSRNGHLGSPPPSANGDRLANSAV